MTPHHQSSTADWLAAYDAAPSAPVARHTPPPVSTPKPKIAVAPILLASIRATQQQATTDWLTELDATLTPAPEPIAVLTDDEFKKREQEAARAHTPVTVVTKRHLTADDLPDTKTIVVKSEHSTGKTTLIVELIELTNENKSILYVVPTRTLARATARKLKKHGFVSYLDDDQLHKTNRVVCCIDSLCKLGDKKFHTVIVDECEQVAASILKQNASFDAGNLAGKLQFFSHHAECVLFLDADAGPRTAQIATRAGLTPHWMHNHFQPMTDVVVERVGYDELLGRYEQDSKQKYLYCSEKTEAEPIHATYGGTLATGSTDNQPLMERITSGEEITENIIATSALGTGVSIDNHGIETVYAILKPGQSLPSALSAIQGMRRARNVKKIVVYCPNVKESEARPVDENEIIERELLRPQRLTLKHMESHWRTDLAGTAFDERLIGLYAAHVADNNRQLNDYWGTIRERLEYSGATVVELVTPEQKSTRRKFLKARRQAQRKRLADQCKTEAIPKRKSYDHSEIQKALFACVDELELPEQEARETAAREILKPGVIAGLKRRRLYQQGQEELQRRDRDTIKSGNPTKKLLSLRAKLEVDLLQQSGIADGWVTSGECRARCQGWLHDRLFEYRGVTGNYSLTGQNTGALVVRVAESLGYEVERKTVKGTVHYRLVRVENCNSYCLLSFPPQTQTAAA